MNAKLLTITVASTVLMTLGMPTEASAICINEPEMGGEIC